MDAFRFLPRQPNFASQNELDPVMSIHNPPEDI